MWGDWTPSRDPESGKFIRKYMWSVPVRLLSPSLHLCLCLCPPPSPLSLSPALFLSLPPPPPASRPDLFFNSHSGQVLCVERSPFFRDVILTVGGWNWTVWREGNKASGGGGREEENWKIILTFPYIAQNGALLMSCSSTVPYTGGAWSPSRPGVPSLLLCSPLSSSLLAPPLTQMSCSLSDPPSGVFFVCKRNGNLEVWDLLDRSHEPALTQNISSLPITAISPFPITC